MLRTAGLIAIVACVAIALMWAGLFTERNAKQRAEAGGSLLETNSTANQAVRNGGQQPENLRSVLPPPVATEIWNASAKRMATTIALLVDRQEFDRALRLTQQALTLPRHPDRNDPYGWGHAAVALHQMLSGYVKAEYWDDLITLASDRSAIMIGNEWVESYRLRALSLAHWKKQQFVFRSRMIAQQLDELKISLATRRHEGEMWNQICMPEDQVEVDLQAFAASEKHIEESLAFIAQLEASEKGSHKDQALLDELKRNFISKRSTSGDAVGEEVDFVIDAAELGLNLTAPEFSLPDATGRTISLADSEGRPTLLVFYLGRGCLHCIKQLKEFGPRIENFEKAGVVVLGISTEKQADLNAAVKAFEGRIPLTLLADGNRTIFRQFGLFPTGLVPDENADGEQSSEPLHATVLIDGSGRILWRDIGVEPFSDIKYLYKEVTRLVEQ